MSRTRHSVNVTKVMGTYIPGLELCTVGAVVKTRQGLKILVMEQYAYAGSGKAVHSYEQIKHRGNRISICTGFGMDIITVYWHH